MIQEFKMSTKNENGRSAYGVFPSCELLYYSYLFLANEKVYENFNFK